MRRGPGGLEIVHPEYKRVASDAAASNEDVLTPIYPLTEGVQQGRLRQLTDMALREFANRSIQDLVPPAVLEQLQLPPLRDALHYVHRPPPDADLDLLAIGQHPMQRRLAFEELLAHQLSLRLLRIEVQRDPGWQFSVGEPLIERFLQTLPFKPTGAQNRAWRDIERDLSQASPMLRLVRF